MIRKAAQIIFYIILVGCSDSNEISESTSEEAMLKKIPSSQSGITFRNVVEENYENFFEHFLYVYNGGGVAVGDINNDGLLDLYFTGNETPNKLYLNKGELKFEDITESAGVSGDLDWVNGVSMVDINGDQLMDIYLCKGGWQDEKEDRKNILYINQGGFTFKNEASKYGLDDTGYSMQATFFDLDNDNDLDMYLINRPDSFSLPLTTMSARRMNMPNDSRDKLYINNNGQFIEEGLQRGIDQNYGYGLSVVTADLNQDGYDDIFVTNDFSVGDYFYLNQKDGTFKQHIKEAFNHVSLYSMGVDISDLNNDALDDLIVMEMRPSDYVRSKVSMPPMNTATFHAIIDHGMHKQYMHNMFYLNQRYDHRRKQI